MVALIDGCSVRPDQPELLGLLLWIKASATSGADTSDTNPDAKHGKGGWFGDGSRGVKRDCPIRCVARSIRIRNAHGKIMTVSEIYVGGSSKGRRTRGLR